MAKRRLVPAVLGTLTFTLTAMAVMALLGFFLARDYFSPKFLEPTTVHANRPEPVRVLSPEEAAAAARDEPSPVWTEGVHSSDIPKLEDEATDTPRRSTRRRRPAATETAPSGNAQPGAAADAPGPAATHSATEAPTAAPAPYSVPDEPISPD